MAKELEFRLKRALELLEKAGQDFKTKKTSFEDSLHLEALKELVKEQVINENSMPSTGEAR
jgi:hypothetical protein